MTDLPTRCETVAHIPTPFSARNPNGLNCCAQPDGIYGFAPRAIGVQCTAGILNGRYHKGSRWNR